ncbi:MAG: RDD family protein [Chloroflexota bacterium]
MNTQEETLDINTPENVAFGYQVAGIGSRFLAAILDTLLIFLLQAAVIAAFLLILYVLDQTALAKNFSAWAIAGLGLVTFLFYWGYYIFFEMLWNGQTPGKRRAGIRVIRTDGTPITLSESLIRNLVRIVDLLPAAYGLGVLTMFIDKQSRRLGDLAAGTLVVHDRAPISIQSLSVRRAVNYSMRGFKPLSLDGFPLERLTNDDQSLIDNFLSRRDQLTHRGALAIQILNTLHVRLGLPLPSISPIDAEDTLIAILQAVQKRQSDEYWRKHDNERTGQ